MNLGLKEAFSISLLSWAFLWPKMKPRWSPWRIKWASVRKEASVCSGGTRHHLRIKKKKLKKGKKTKRLAGQNFEEVTPKELQRRAMTRMKKTAKEGRTLLMGYFSGGKREGLRKGGVKMAAPSLLTLILWLQPFPHSHLLWIRILPKPTERVLQHLNDLPAHPRQVLLLSRIIEKGLYPLPGGEISPLIEVRISK